MRVASQCAVVALALPWFGCSNAVAGTPSPTEEAPPLVQGPAVLMANMIPVRVRRARVEAPSDPCPGDMVLVEGEYCPNVLHRCMRTLDPPGRYEHFRCAEYAPPRCLSRKRVSMRFCMDVDEFTIAGEALPANFRSYSDGERECARLGKRLCRESEWNFACEGEAMQPYPYGFDRDSSACNADRSDILDERGRLKDLRAPGDAYPRCTSPFGIRNLAGNLEEFVTIDGSSPPRPAMKGAYWQPGRNHCRAAQTAHDRYYHGMETGFRCCAPAPAASPGPAR